MASFDEAFKYELTGTGTYCCLDCGVVSVCSFGLLVRG